MCLPAYLPVYSFAYLFVVYLTACLFVCQSQRLPACLSVYLSVSVSCAFLPP